MPSTSRTSRGVPATVRILICARVVNRIGAFTLPFLAVYLTGNLGASVAQAGMVLSLFGVATIPSRIVGGYLADRVGGKATIVLGLAGCTACQAWIATVDSLPAAVVATGLLGLVFEIYEPPTGALIADAMPADRRPQAYSLLGAAMAVAAVAAGLLAAVIGQWDLRWLFAADALTCALGALLVAVGLPRHPQQPRTEQTAAAPARVWRDTRLLTLLATGTVLATLYLQIPISLPLTLVERQLPATQLGILLAVSALIVVLAQPVLRTRALREIDSFRALTLGHLLLGAGLFVNGFATSLTEFVLATITWSLGEALLTGHLTNVVVDMAPRHARSRYLAVHGSSWGIAAALAPMAGAQLLTATGPEGLWSMCAVAALALAAVQPALRRWLRRS
ncbi:MAG: MFS transporter [Actinopolymorphaceae bacterium]